MMDPPGQHQRIQTAAQTPPTTASDHSSYTNSTRPGAYQVSRSSPGPALVYRVEVPTGVRPGQEFTVHAGARRVRVRNPPTGRPGHSLHITLPSEPVTRSTPLRAAALTATTGSGNVVGGAVAMLAHVERINQKAKELGGIPRTQMVTIPPNIYPGMFFKVTTAGGERFQVCCPPSASPSDEVRTVLPPQRREPEAVAQTQVFEVAVPRGVRPGQQFTIVASGLRVPLTCPANAEAEKKIRFELPMAQVLGNIQLAYRSEKNGWKRMIRATDLKFQWVRPMEAATNTEEKHKVEIVDQHIDAALKSAYVRKITFLEGNDVRMRTGSLELVPAGEAVVDSKFAINDHLLLSHEDVSQMQGRPVEEKKAWFEGICKQLAVPWEDGHVKICVRRSHLLMDSVNAVMSLSRDDMHKQWRVEFLDEPALDASGPTKEWFELVSKQVFDPDYGLWVTSPDDQARVDINPSSGMCSPDDHLITFRFIGRFIGRALLDSQLIKGRMTKPIYKHLLGWPIAFEDIKDQDEKFYECLRSLTKLDDVSTTCLDFTITEEHTGKHTTIDLVEGGSEKEVTNNNLAEYLEAVTRYRLFERTLPQLTELLLGFFDSVPEAALTVFDANDLEMILCGRPSIDVDDWQANTNYKSLFKARGEQHQVVQWFWEIVRHEFDQKMRESLLQFVTGTSGVPLRGFAYLRGVDGSVQKFTIVGYDSRQFRLPLAHTCFNRIALPNYGSKRELLEMLKMAILNAGEGFGLQ